MSKERTCLFCQKSYQYCPNCKDYSSEPAWKFNFDTEKCHELYKVIAGYNIGVRPIEDVKATLNKYGVTDYSIFSKALREKLSEDTSEKKEEPKVETKEEPEVETKEELEVETKEESEEEAKVETKEESNQKKQVFSKGNNNYYPRKMKKNNYGRRDGE